LKSRVGFQSIERRTLGSGESDLAHLAPGNAGATIGLKMEISE